MMPGCGELRNDIIRQSSRDNFDAVNLRILDVGRERDSKLAVGDVDVEGFDEGLLGAAGFGPEVHVFDFGGVADFEGEDAGLGTHVAFIVFREMKFDRVFSIRHGVKE